MERFSIRSRHNIKAVMPQIPQAILNAQDEPGLDMAAAENWVLRDEMVNLSKDSVAIAMNGSHLSWPLGFYGAPSLLAALARFVNDHMAPCAVVREDEIVVLPGASGCIMSLLWNLCDAGEGVLMPTRYWVGFSIYSLVRAKTKLVDVRMPNLEDALSVGVLLALEQAYAAAEVSIRVLMISNPNNPLGKPWPKEVLEAMLRFCQDKGIHFVSDEVFGPVVFDCPDMPDATPFTSVLSLDLEAQGVDPWRSHVIWSPNKMLGLSGLRLGCVISRAGSELRNGLALSALQEVSVVSSLLVTPILDAPSFSELLALSAKRLTEHYALLSGTLKKLGIRYQPCNASLSIFARLCPDAQTWDDEKALIVQLKEVGVIVGGGRMYHVPENEKGWARITFAVERKTLEEGVKRLTTFFQQPSGHRGKDIRLIG